jgi:hypothetical protein
MCRAFDARILLAIAFHGLTPAAINCRPFGPLSLITGILIYLITLSPLHPFTPSLTFVLTL